MVLGMLIQGGGHSWYFFLKRGHIFEGDTHSRLGTVSRKFCNFFLNKIFQIFLSWFIKSSQQNHRRSGLPRLTLHVPDVDQYQTKNTSHKSEASVLLLCSQSRWSNLCLLETKRKPTLAHGSSSCLLLTITVQNVKTNVRCQLFLSHYHNTMICYQTQCFCFRIQKMTSISCQCYRLQPKSRALTCSHHHSRILRNPYFHPVTVSYRQIYHHRVSIQSVPYHHFNQLCTIHQRSVSCRLHHWCLALLPLLLWERPAKMNSLKFLGNRCPSVTLFLVLIWLHRVKMVGVPQSSK